MSRDETRAAGAGLCWALVRRCQADLQSRGRAGRVCVLEEDCFVGGLFCLFSVLGPLYATHHLHCCLQDCTFLLPLPFEQTVSLDDDPGVGGFSPLKQWWSRGWDIQSFGELWRRMMKGRRDWSSCCCCRRIHRIAQQAAAMLEMRWIQKRNQVSSSNKFNRRLRNTYSRVSSSSWCKGKGLHGPTRKLS